MRTRSSSNLVGESSPNPTTSNPKRRNCRRSNQPFIFEESLVDTMADQRTMAELLRTPTEGYSEAIVVPPILAEHFELKHSLINMMTSDQFFGLEKDNHHDHIRWFNKITSKIKYKDDMLTIIENKSNVCNSRNKSIVSQVKSSDANSSSSSEIAKLAHVVNQQTSAVTTAMTAIFKQFQATPPPASVKAVEEICVTCGAAVNYSLGNSGYRPPSVANQIRPSDFAQPNVQNNQNRFSQPQGYNQGNNFNQDTSYQAPIQQNQVVPLSELEKIKKMNEINIKAMQTQINNVKNELGNEMKTLIQASKSNQTNELKNMMASFFQMNTASTSGSGPLLATPLLTRKEDEHVEETLTDPDLTEYTIKVLHPLVQKAKPPSQRNYVEKLLELANTPLNENCLAVILKKLPKKLGDPGEFLIPCSFSELKYKALADLANQTICTLVGIARDVFVLVGKFTFPVDFVIVDYESDPRVPLILGRPFLRTARALIAVHEEEMILRDGDERLTLNMRHGTSSYSNEPKKESINMINIYNDSYEDYLEDLFATNHLSGNLTFSSHTNLTSPEVINPLSGNPTSSSPDHLLEEFTDELTLITFPLGNDDLLFDIESDLREIEYLLNHDPTKEMDSILEDSIDECNLADPDNDLSDNDDAYNDPFDSKEDKIKESKLLIDELDPPGSSDFLPSPEYDSFLFDDFSEVDALPSTNNEDKVFNPGILIQENLSKVTIRVTSDKNVKKTSISNASLILEDFNPPLYELPFHKEVPWSETLLSFSS
nr:hypothetical protein [Tanacetum cinerariifolium]